MEENKNYTEPEQIEQAEDVKPEEVASTEETAIPEEVTPVKSVDVNESETKNKMSEKKPMNKKLLIIIGAAVLAIAIVVGVILLFPNIINIGFLPEETTPEVTTPEITTPVENPENYPVDADSKQEDIFYN